MLKKKGKLPFEIFSQIPIAPLGPLYDVTPPRKISSAKVLVFYCIRKCTNCCHLMMSSLTL